MTIIGGANTANQSQIIQSEGLIGKAKDLKQAQELAAGQAGSEAILRDPATGEYQVHALAASSLSVQELKSATVTPGIVAFSFDEDALTQGEDELVVTQDFADGLAADHRGALRQELKDLYGIGDAQADNRLGRDLTDFTGRFNRLPAAERARALSHLGSLDAAQRKGFMQLFLLDKKVLDGVADGSLLKTDSTGKTILDQMTRILKGTLPAGLLAGHKGNLYETRQQFIKDFSEVARGENQMLQSKNNCGVATMNHMVSVTDTGNYLRMAADLILTGESLSPGGTRLSLPKNPYHSPFGRIDAPHIVEGALNKLAKGPDYDLKSEEDIGLMPDDMMALMKQVTGEDFVSVGEGFFDHLAEAFSVKGNDQEAYDALIQAKAKGKLPAFAGVIFDRFKSDSSKRPFIATFHMISVLDIDTSKKPPMFTLHDPNSGEVKMDGDKFLLALASSVPRK